jgi:vacuolar protein sorting-associated protein VTA1
LCVEMSVIPATFKNFTSAIKRAEELEKDQSREKRVLAYYCRMYVVSKGARLATSAPEDRKFLEEQLVRLETMKPSLGLSGDEGSRICQEQALEVFNKADEIDRMGLADKSTVKLFYSAGTFFEILEQFGPLDADIVERKKYAKWKAAEIMNAVNNGEIPTPGGYGEAPGSASSAASVISPPPSSAQAVTSPTSSSANPPTPTPGVLDIPSAPSFSVFGQAAASSVSSAASHSFNAYTAAASPYANLGQTSPLPLAADAYSGAAYPGASRAPPLNNADPRVKDTVELCNFAIAALKHNEIALARDRLQEALRRLG